MAKIKQSLSILTYYHWVVLIAVVVLGSWYLSFKAWNYLHYPVLLDMFWSPSLGMYEPVYAPPNPEWVNAIMFLPSVGLMWWYSPLWFQIPYTVSFIWLVFYIWIWGTGDRW